ncbi:unnamed protein product [Brachionus calyciflorus]|uniref:Large ribosomal subunit protein mL54 n=1 Tax=Brachionus calyciflorus TaxID=104777 RepID=A0A813SBB5_9BILA|nr:unnamed protein product [Brachionus calyciflorus]
MNNKLSLFFENAFSAFKSTQRYLAAPAKPGGAFSGGKLGGGVSKKGGAQQVRKIEIPIETDAKKLANFVCGLNIVKKDGVEVPIKPDSEYPEWLWSLNVDKGPSLEEMQKDTLQYWARKRRLALRHKNKLMKNEFPQPFIPNKIKNLRLA